MNETHIIWCGAGSPEPCDPFGVPIPKARKPGDHCARCGGGDAVYSIRELISSNFVPTRNANRIKAFGGLHYCAACVFCARTLRLRCCAWFATPEAVRFWRTRPDMAQDDSGEWANGPRPDALAALLDPPEPPFVCGIPFYGMSHGGESTPKDAPDQGPNYLRTWWPGETAHEKPLTKLQSKHVAIYSRVAQSRDRYPVQVDDALDFLLDRDLWLRLRDEASRVADLLVADGVKPYPAKKALERLQLPYGVSAVTAANWPRLTAPLLPHHRANWWRLFVEFFPTPEGVQNETTRKGTDDRGPAARNEADPAPARVPAASDQEADPKGKDRGEQILLPGF